MQVQFISSVSIITPDPPKSRRLYIDALGLPLESPPDDEYVFSEHVGGTKHFGVWPLWQAAQACFGTRTWPTDRVVPQVSIEFEVETAEAVGPAAQELEARGFVLLHGPRTEPWGQTVARIQSSEGAIIGLSFAPWMHQSGDVTN
jgi:catechol 2,3-dioxygenase-like lactoylglutathione lyase family enzyme